MCTSTRCDRPDPAAQAAATAYATVHQWLRRRRGPASARTCPCGQQAAHWAYTGPRSAGQRRPFSTDLGLYAAMCRSCHRRHDLAPPG